MFISNQQPPPKLGGGQTPPLLPPSSVKYDMHDKGTRQSPRLLRSLFVSAVSFSSMIPRWIVLHVLLHDEFIYGTLSVSTWLWRNLMYPIASISTEAVSVLPKGATNCWRAAILSPNFSFLTLKGGHEARDSSRGFLVDAWVVLLAFLASAPSFLKGHAIFKNNQNKKINGIALYK